MGFALQLVERRDEIPALIDNDEVTQTCDAWREHAKAIGLDQGEHGGGDSGAFVPPGSAPGFAGA